MWCFVRDVPKVVGSIPTVARHIFQVCPVWIYIQGNITSIRFTWLHYTNTGFQFLKGKKRVNMDTYINWTLYLTVTERNSMFCKHETGSRQGYWKARIPKTNLFQVTRKDMETSTMFDLQHDNFISHLQKSNIYWWDELLPKGSQISWLSRDTLSCHAMQCNAMPCKKT
jgi:hypothetical protein